MGHEYNGKMFYVHKSSMLHGALVGAGSFWPKSIWNSHLDKFRQQHKHMNQIVRKAIEHLP
jgi:hypothetical protein